MSKSGRKKRERERAAMQQAGEGQKPQTVISTHQTAAGATVFGRAYPGTVYQRETLPPAPGTFTQACRHGQWVELGVYRVWMQDFFAKTPGLLDVFIDLECGFSSLQRYVPSTLAKYVVEPKPLRMKWEIRDGGVDPGLADTVVRMLKAGYKVGWGCQGGHGRTGWLAAKVLMLLTRQDGSSALKYIREKYCGDAVETRKQLADLGAEVEAKSFEAEEYTNYVRWWDTRQGIKV